MKRAPLAEALLKSLKAIERRPSKKGRAAAEELTHLKLCAVELLRDLGNPPEVVVLFDQLLGRPLDHGKKGLKRAAARYAVIERIKSWPDTGDSELGRLYTDKLKAADIIASPDAARAEVRELRRLLPELEKIKKLSSKTK